MEEYIREVCDHLDIIEDELSAESVDVNTTRRNNHIPSEIVRLVRDAHVRTAHMPAHELAKLITNGATADIPKFTAAQVLKVHERWPCIYCKSASARIGSGVKQVESSWSSILS